MQEKRLWIPMYCLNRTKFIVNKEDLGQGGLIWGTKKFEDFMLDFT